LVVEHVTQNPSAIGDGSFAAAAGAGAPLVTGAPASGIAGAAFDSLPAAQPHAAAPSSIGSIGSPAIAAASFHSVEIVAKPKPEYTAEARRMRIEGEVWIEVLFSADGSVRIQRILRSLGHGLDENAVMAARHIRFYSARDGARPVDQVATIRVQFQLAD
jgi:protein TonB